MLRSFQMLDRYLGLSHSFLNEASDCCPLLEKIPTINLDDVNGES